MTKEIIGWIITGVAIWLVLLPTLWGMARGKRQSAFRLVWVILTGVFSLLASILLANLLISVVKIGGKSVPEFVFEKLENSNANIRQTLADNPEMREKLILLVSEVIMAGARVVLFVVLFWLLKWLLFPIWKIIAKKHYSKKANRSQIKMKDGTVVPVADQKPQKKGVLLGGVYGFLMGLFVMILTFAPFTAVNTLVFAVEEQTKTDGKGIISTILKENAEYLSVYSDSMIGKAFAVTKVEVVQNFVCDQLTVINLGGKRASLTQEANQLAPLYSDVKKLMDFDFNAATQSKVTDILPVAKRVMNKVLDSELVKGFYGTFRDYIVDGMLDTEKQFFVKLPTFEDATLNTAVRDSFAQIKTIEIEDIKKDLNNAVDVVDEMNTSSNLVVDFIKRDISFEKIRDGISVQLASSINQKFADIKLVQNCFPIVFNPLAKIAVDKIPSIEYGGEEIKIVWTDAQNVSSQKLKEYLDEFLVDAVTIVKGISSDETEFEAADCMKVAFGGQEYYIKYGISSNLGGMIDDLKNSSLMNSNTFDSVMTYLESTGKNYVESALNDEKYQDLVLAVDRIIDTVKNETSFRIEFDHLGKALKAYNISDQSDIEAVFVAIDKIKPTYLYSHNIGAGFGEDKNQDSEYVYGKLNLFLKDFINQNYSDTIQLTIEDVENITGKIPAIESFKTEYDIIEDFLNYIGENQSDILKTSVLKQIGHHLDEVTVTSKIVDKTLCAILLKSVVLKMELPYDFSDIMIGDLTINQKLAQNVDLVTAYESELEKIGILINTNYDAISNFAGYGHVIDEICDSKFLDGVISPIIVDRLNQYDEDFEDYGNLFNDIKTNINKLTEGYETEFEYFDKLVDLMKEADFDNLQDIKDYIEENFLDEDGKSKSIVLDDKVLYDLISASLDDVKIDTLSLDDFGNLKNDIKSKLEDDFVNEVSILDVLDGLDLIKNYYVSDLKDGLEITIDTTKQDLQNFGGKIDALKNSQFDKVLNQNAVNDIGRYIVDGFNQSIQDSTSIDAGKKEQIEQICGNINWMDEVNFATLFGNFADVLEIE